MALLVLFLAVLVHRFPAWLYVNFTFNLAFFFKLESV